MKKQKAMGMVQLEVELSKCCAEAVYWVLALSCKCGWEVVAMRNSAIRRSVLSFTRLFSSSINLRL